MPRAKTYKNKHFTKRDYEATNIIACVAEVAPDDNWIEADESVLKGLTQLWIEKDVRYYGYL